MREITLYHVHAPQIGYGRLGVNLAAALTDAGVDVYDDQDMPEQYRFAHEVEGARQARSKRCHTVAWIAVPGHARGWWQGQHKVVMTMWEATRLPESFRQSLHEFAVVVVPSHQNQELFSRYHDNVHMVPLGVDPAVWHYQPRDVPASEFRFLIGGTGPRKGTDLAYKAFRAVFPYPAKLTPTPYLVMKNPRREDFGGPYVEVVGGHISPQAEVDLYAGAHCYLQPSRGEGFGLQPLQALAQGCPTILTGAHGHDSFAHLGHSLSTTMAKSEYFIYGEAGDWWEPDFDELCDHMRWVYDHYGDACAKAWESSRVIAADFTWARCAQRFIDAVGPEHLEVPYSGDGTWVRPELRRYLVVTNRTWSCEISGVSYQFTKGERYFEMADVKRILFEANLLDPVCLTPDVDEDIGLTVAQVERLGAYSSRHAYCELCHQRLNSVPTRADDIEADLIEEALVDGHHRV